MRVAIGISLLALLLVSCGSDQPKLDPDLDVGALLATSSDEMGALDSYHVRFVIAAHPEDVRDEHVWAFDVVRPDSYRFVLHSANGDEKRVCEIRGHGQTCTTVLTSITERSLFEGLYVGDVAYGRQCDGKGNNCNDWEQEPRPETPLFGPSSTYLPQWPIVVLEMIEDAESVAMERISGVETVQIQGSVNMIRAIFENQRRVLEPLGVTTFGTQCGSQDIQMNTEGSFGSTQSEPTPACRDLSLEETLERQENVAFQDENPPTVNVWISPEDGRVHRITITGPLEAGGESKPMTIDYSDFNEAKVEAPE